MIELCIGKRKLPPHVYRSVRHLDSQTVEKMCDPYAWRISCSLHPDCSPSHITFSFKLFNRFDTFRYVCFDHHQPIKRERHPSKTGDDDEDDENEWTKWIFSELGIQAREKIINQIKREELMDDDDNDDLNSLSPYPVWIVWFLCSWARTRVPSSSWCLLS